MRDIASARHWLRIALQFCMLTTRRDLGRDSLRTFALVVAAFTAFSTAAEGRDIQPVARFEILSRELAFDGAPVGEVGPYEQITAIAHLQIDPRARENRGIVDLDKAPRDAQGIVHYDVDVVILRPRDAVHARRVLLYDVVNRGLRLLDVAFGDAGADSIFLREGFTLVWSGWQGDVDRNDLVGARFPIATNGRRPITGRVTAEAVFDDQTTRTIALTYPATSLDQVAAELSVRQYTADPAQTVPPTQWRYQNERTVSLDRPANMDAGAIYTFSYEARDP